LPIQKPGRQQECQKPSGGSSKKRHSESFTERAKQQLRLRQDEGGDWEMIAGDMRSLGEEILGKTSGKAKVGKETWWWCDEVQKCISEKKAAKKKVFEEPSADNKTNYKRAKKEAKRAVAIAKARAYERLYSDLDTEEGTKKVLRMAKQRDKNSKDIYQTKLIKSEEGRVLVKDEKILKRWKEYFSELMNEENPREQRQAIQVVNSEDMTTITVDEVKRALKKMKNGKAVGPDNLPIEVWKCLGEEGASFLCMTLNRICEEEKIPGSWRKSVLIPIYKNKGDIMLCGNYRGIMQAHVPYNEAIRAYHRKQTKRTCHHQ